MNDGVIIVRGISNLHDGVPFKLGQWLNPKSHIILPQHQQDLHAELPLDLSDFIISR